MRTYASFQLKYFGHEVLGVALAPLQVGAEEVRPLQVGIDEPGTLQVSAAEDRPLQVGTLEPRTLQVGVDGKPAAKAGQVSRSGR